MDSKRHPGQISMLALMNRSRRAALLLLQFHDLYRYACMIEVTRHFLLKELSVGERTYAALSTTL